MKKLTWILTFLISYTFCFSQESQEIVLNYNWDKKEFNEKTESIKFKNGVTYNIKINGINTSIIGYKIKSKAYTMISTVPDILKPYLGISEEPVLNEIVLKQIIAGEKPKPEPDSIFLKSKELYKKLCDLKKESDLLYKCTKTATNITKACEAQNNVKRIFDAESIDDLKEKVILYSKYVILAQEIYKKSLEENTSNNTMIDKYNKLSYWADTIKSKNYLLYANFIENSVKAKNTIEYKPFKAEKDIVDLNMTFIDTYVKDTIYNSSVSFYTNRNHSFDFSTGFL